MYNKRKEDRSHVKLRAARRDASLSRVGAAGAPRVSRHAFLPFHPGCALFPDPSPSPRSSQSLVPRDIGDVLAMLKQYPHVRDPRSGAMVEVLVGESLLDSIDPGIGKTPLYICDLRMEIREVHFMRYRDKELSISLRVHPLFLCDLRLRKVLCDLKIFVEDDSPRRSGGSSRDSPIGKGTEKAKEPSERMR